MEMLGLKPNDGFSAGCLKKGKRHLNLLRILFAGREGFLLDRKRVLETSHKRIDK